ncbi:hypothetical protein Cgig2_005340 [Carnegiea gigantea]|uniref:Uncharacterized protein n=1 Tax=Carnegiea gigantea TaxID=171969 RepID=A0A9Q1K700_9CARY|nr:hypothetical protein Cgig2_005340 [Carnegiea gigantea]
MSLLRSATMKAEKESFWACTRTCIRKNNLLEPSNRGKTPFFGACFVEDAILPRQQVTYVETVLECPESDLSDNQALNQEQEEKVAGSIVKLYCVSLELQAIVEDLVSCRRQQMDVEDGAELPEGASVVTIPDALALLLGTTTREMVPPEASQHIVCAFRDPSSMAVVCDAKLAELFGRNMVTVLEVKNLLPRHRLFQTSLCGTLLLSK